MGGARSTNHFLLINIAYETEKGKLAYRRYNQSDKGKASRQRYNESEKGKINQKKARQKRIASGKNAEYCRRYRMKKKLQEQAG